ncbi:MAG: hypothetical protein D6814_06355, partial [Calditrichaeota bacterium]
MDILAKTRQPAIGIKLISRKMWINEITKIPCHLGVLPKSRYQHSSQTGDSRLHPLSGRKQSLEHVQFVHFGIDPREEIG